VVRAFPTTEHGSPALGKATAAAHRLYRCVRVKTSRIISHAALRSGRAERRSREATELAPKPRSSKGAKIGHATTAQFLLAFVVGAVVGAAVFVHADKNGSRHPTAWAFSVFLFLAVALPVYVIHVRRNRRRLRS
jgi:Flp pilus assembly protein TadB